MSICEDSANEDSCSNDGFILHTANVSRPVDTSSSYIMEKLSQMLDTKLAPVAQDLVRIDSRLSAMKQEISKEIKNEFVQAIDQIKQEFSDTTDFLSEQIKSFKAELCTMNNKVKVLEVENSRLNAEIVAIKKHQSCQPSASELQNIIDQMHSELNEREQTLLLTEVEITGVPEYQSESSTHIVQAIAKKLGMTIDEQDIVSVVRAGPKRLVGAEGDTKPRPRPLVVKLTRRSIRDDLLRNARVRRGLTTENIGLPDGTPSRVYVNERLTKTNRRIFHQARLAAGAVNWKFVWTKEGRIFSRRTDSGESRAVQIKSEKDIKRVFGVDLNVSDSK
ncbi:uncharacterized protein LOC135073509 [Ostrinia nubilalis]|uniref:uncharacterized protein LOC135073509 n=1 Tax=Ostrinia nubilalis TaxID=29057 RepID=UPI0030825F7B